jgi:nucleoside-diphosphate-sugar epimerase
MNPRTVLITGASGNLGRKLRVHLAHRYELRLLDRDSRNDSSVAAVDLARWGEWYRLFDGVDVVVHFAADPEAFKPLSELVAPNVDALIHTYQASALAKIKRIVYASSNHVMGGYQDDSGVSLSGDTPPRPGLRYQVEGIPRSSTAYAHAKLFGERLGKCFAESHGIETIAVRIGWVWRGGDNVPENLPPERGEWFRLMWLSDRDFLHLMDRCLVADLSQKFVIVNGMSNNAGMPWDLTPGRRLIQFEPQDDVTRYTHPWTPTSPEA